MNRGQIEGGWAHLKETATENWEQLSGGAGRIAAVATDRARCVAKAASGRLREPAERPRRVPSKPAVPRHSPLAAGVKLVGLGAGMMYFFDPNQGRRRQALARDRIIHLAHEIDEAIGVVSRDLGNLERHGDPPGIRALAGDRTRTGERSELCQGNWSPTTRFVVGSAGTLFLASATQRRGVSQWALAAAGTGLLFRAITNMPASQWGGVFRHWQPQSTPQARQPARDSGEPGGGRGRTDVVGRTGVYPATGPYPPDGAPMRTPESFVHGQRDDLGREVEGGSEPIYFNRQTLLGGATPPPSGSPASDDSEQHGNG